MYVHTLIKHVQSSVLLLIKQLTGFCSLCYHSQVVDIFTKTLPNSMDKAYIVRGCLFYYDILCIPHNSYVALTILPAELQILTMKSCQLL